MNPRVRTVEDFIDKQAAPMIDVAYIAPIVKVLNNNGIEIQTLLTEIGLPVKILDSKENKITLTNFQNLLLGGASLTNDPFFGLHVGEAFTMVSNLIGFIMINCSTPEEALGKYIEFQKLTNDTVNIQILQNKDYTSFEVTIKDNDLNNDTHHVDFYMAGSLSYWQALTGIQVQAIKAQFTHPTPADISEYERVFNCQLVFNGERNVLHIPTKFMIIPNLHPNRELLMFFEKNVDDFYREMTAEGTFTDKVRKKIIELNSTVISSESEIAKHFVMSASSLQNRLKEEGTTFLEIRDSLRKEKAMEYLKDRNISIKEISYLLGFSEPSAFHRSFKKWTSETPNGWRLKYFNSSSKHK